VPFAVHEQYAQVKAIDGGKMDRFDKNPGCHEADGYLCYTQFSPDQIPNLAALARAFVVSDRTFEDGTNPSWGSHLDLVATQLDGFLPGGPPGTAPGTGLGLGCDSGLDAPWRPTPDATAIQVPACVPKPDGSGPYRPSPVTWVPTIMDRLQQMNRSWRIYAALDEGIGYGWAICPTFADCIYSRQARHLVSKDQVLTDAQAGTLPNFSIVVPKANDSQHNNQSMLRGDNWIGSVVSAIMNGPDWRSTAIFITYDDCGCFYDHVPPPPNLGIRVPMVIVSPYARSGYTDSNNASYASMLAFVEHNFGIPPLSNVDGNAYDYANSFDYGQKPLAPIPLHQRELPTAEQQWLAEHPAPPDDT